jgi:hypothetical protein
MPPTGRLRVRGHGDAEVELVAGYLTDLTRAYGSLVVFELVMARMERAARYYPAPPWALFFTSTGTLVWPHDVSWPPTPEAVTSLVPYSQRLVLTGVELHSPGAWEFLGSLNPLEVIRKYLNDRHERRKDREYRESAEKRRSHLENLKLEDEVFEGRIRIAKELGATDDDLAPLLNEFVNKPLAALDAYQDKGLIEDAEIEVIGPSPPRPSEGTARRGTRRR